MNDYELLEDLGDLESDDEFEDAIAEFLAEDDEARRRGTRRRPVRTGRGGTYARQRPTSRYVTQAQLQSALAKVSKDVKANAVGIKTVGARVDAVKADQEKQTALLKKETTERRRESAKLRNSVQMGALLPILTTKTITVEPGQTIPVKETTKLVVAPDTLGLLLPMMLFGDGFGGGGGSGSDGSGGYGGDNNMSMMLTVLALSGSL